MPEVRDSLRFILNGEDVELRDVSATRTLLDFLRLDRRLVGSKEGCAEGDCGACTVLVGRLSGDELLYETVNACICFVGSLDGTHVVTVEHLSTADGPLHPVQQAMVDYHGSQCGFCTPGIVMSLYGLWMRSPTPTAAEAEQALQGNLCRCTGYAPIIRAAKALTSMAMLRTTSQCRARRSRRGLRAARRQAGRSGRGQGAADRAGRCRRPRRGLSRRTQCDADLGSHRCRTLGYQVHA